MREFLKNWYGKSSITYVETRVHRPQGIKKIVFYLFCHTLDFHFMNKYKYCSICGLKNQTNKTCSVFSLRRRFNKQKRKPIYRVYKMIRWILLRGKCPICKVKMPFPYPRLYDRTDFTMATFDHKIALINGGSNRLSNLQVICAQCNFIKGREEDKRHGVKKSKTATLDKQGKRYTMTLADLIKENALDKYKPTVYTVNNDEK